MSQGKICLLVLTGAALAVGACGGSGGASPDAGEPMGTQAIISGIRTPAGDQGTYHPGMIPPPGATPGVAPVPPNGTGINGGSLLVPISTGGTALATIFVGIDGVDGYWDVPVRTPEAEVGPTEQVLLTFARQLPPGTDMAPILIATADRAGNVGVPATMAVEFTRVSSGDVQVSLAWDVDSDLDLHVVDPNGFEIYWEKRQSPERGEMDLDSNAICVIDGIRNENIFWPTGKAPHGTYTVRVDNFENCESALATYAVTVQKDGQPPQTFLGFFPSTELGDGGKLGAGMQVATFTYP